MKDEGWATEGCMMKDEGRIVVSYFSFLVFVRDSLVREYFHRVSHEWAPPSFEGLRTSAQERLAMDENL